MASFTPITGGELDRWTEVRRRLLRPTIDPMDYDGYHESPFNDPDWRIVPVVNQFRDGDEVAGPDSGGWPCREGPPDIDGYGEPLMWCLEKRGCREIVLSTDWGNRKPLRPEVEAVRYCRCRPDLDAIYDAAKFLSDEGLRCGGGFLYCVMAFDETEDWAVADGCEGHHLLGGTPAFMDQYFEAAGGEDYVRAWFYHYEMWNIIDYDPSGVYKLAGWPEPIPPEGGLWANSGGDIDWSPMFGDQIKSCGPDKEGKFD